MYTVGMDVDKLEIQFVFTEKILLYAGKSYINSPLIIIIIIIVFGTIYLLFNGLSAGNFNLNTNINTGKNFKDLPLISEHVPKHVRLLRDEDLGYFLAGLIEGNGWFDFKLLNIKFSEKDIPLAYFLKKRIGYGTVSKIKNINDKGVLYSCKHEKGLIYIISLINGKLVSCHKYNELIKHNYNEYLNIEIIFPTYKLTLDNYWLTGFTQAVGYFNILIIDKDKTEWLIKLNYLLKHNDEIPLKLLYSYLNIGNLSKCSNEIWCYKSTEYLTSYHLIKYFDKFPLFGNKYVSFLKFRKVYIMITEGKHLSIEGLKKIKSIKSKGSSETSTQEV